MFVLHDVYFLLTLFEVHYLQKTDHVMPLHSYPFLFCRHYCPFRVFIPIYHHTSLDLFQYLVIWLYKLYNIAAIVLSIPGVEGKVWGEDTPRRHKHTNLHVRPFSLLKFLS